jgi:hypothetical protein
VRSIGEVLGKGVEFERGLEVGEAAKERPVEARSRGPSGEADLDLRLIGRKAAVGWRLPQRLGSSYRGLEDAKKFPLQNKKDK